MVAAESSRVAVVTGGTGALGRWVVRDLAARGLRVHVPVRSMAAVEEARSFLEKELGGAQARGVHFPSCDVTEPDEVEGVVETIVDGGGRLDVLVNAVGGFTMAPVEETTPEEWRRMMDLNATSAFFCSRAVVPPMKEARWGRIVNVASFPALERGASGMSAYAASKAALLSLTRSLAQEVLGSGITVNAVVPRIIDTPANRDAMPDADRTRWLAPVEIARVVGFLAGDDAGIVTGAAVPLEKG